MTSLGPVSPYRNDDEARELYVAKLEAENHELTDENEKLRAENKRLYIIGTELAKAPPPTAKPPLSEFDRIFEEVTRRNYELQQEILSLRHMRSRVLLLIVVIAMMPGFVRLIFGPY